MNNKTKSEPEGAGCATGAYDEGSELFLDKTQILRSIHEAYGAGRPVESVMRERMAIIRAGVSPEDVRTPLPSVEYGRSIYKKRRCGKVASFFRCLLR